MFAYCYFDNEKFPSRISTSDEVYRVYQDIHGRIYYPCEYEISEDGEMEVTIAYDLSFEIMDRKGTNHVSSSEEAEKRDILIHDENKTFFLKNANGLRFATKGKCKFIAYEYFEFESQYLYDCEHIFFAKCILDEPKDSFLKFVSEWKGENSDYWRKIFVENSNKNTVEDALKAIRFKLFYWKKLFLEYSLIDDEFNRKWKDSMFKIFSEYKVKSIYIHSESLSEYIASLLPGRLRWEVSESKREAIKYYDRRFQSKSIDIKFNNISKIWICDYIASISYRSDELDKLVEYIKIDLIKAVDCSEVYDYLEEIMVYFQLFCPNKIKIDKVEIDTEGGLFKFVTARFNRRFNNDAIVSYSGDILHFMSVKKENILDFLGKCYNRIVYRKPTHEKKLAVKLIDEIIFSNMFKMWLEITFLHCFTFIEFYYKKCIKSFGEDLTNEEYIKSLCCKLKSCEELKSDDIEFITRSLNDKLSKGAPKFKEIIFWAIKKFYNGKEKLSDDEKNRKAHEIVFLRNRYSHEGYYLPSDLRISYKNGSEKTFEKVDLHLVYELLRTVLFPIVMDIIFKDILGYDNHDFPSPFPEGLV